MPTAGNVLIVDDHAGARAALARVLASAVDVVKEASDAEMALNMLMCGNFDVVVTDLRMGEVSGIDLLRTIRDNDQHLPVIVVTGNADVRSAADAVELRAFRYFEKPVDPKRFLAAIRLAVAERRGL